MRYDLMNVEDMLDRCEPDQAMSISNDSAIAWFRALGIPYADSFVRQGDAVIVPILAAIADQAKEVVALRASIAELEAERPHALKEKLRSAEARIAELERAQQWQPIEIAPKDVPSRRPVLVCWSAKQLVQFPPAVAYLDNGEWFDVGEIGWCEPPAYWMPLPEAPNQ